MIARVFRHQMFSDLFHFKGMREFIVFLILSFIFNGECTPRPFYRPEMCRREGSIDCSFQMADDQKHDTCKVYNTSECHNFDFSGWMRQSSKRPALQSDSIYAVGVSPYALTDVQMQLQIFAAINITLTTSNEDVDGYVLLMENPDVNINICRIFDFRNSSSKNYAMLFYDCLFYLISKGTQNFELKVRVLPHNEEMLYTLFLPDAQNIETDDACQWKPLVMVYNGGFQNNVVEVKFSQAPQHFNISSYEVLLLSKTSSLPVQKIIVEATGDALLNAMFSHVDRGFYSISVRPFFSISSHHCGTTEYTVFFIENKIIDKIVISYILAICFTGGAVIFTVLLLLWWLFKRGPITVTPVVLLVYSYDCKEHDIAVLRFAKFLENQCGMKVLTIYGEQRSDPDMWLFSPYRNCDIVIIIVSEGVFYKCENGNNPAMEEGYPCGDRLIPAVSFLKDKMLSNEKSFIQVYFEYSGTCHVPSFLQLGKWGKAFVIPREMNRLLCKMYNQNPKIACLGQYPRMPGHDVISSPEGEALVNSIEEMKQVLNENHDVQRKWNEFSIKKLEINNERHTPRADEKNRLRSTNCERFGYLFEPRHPSSDDDGKKCVECDSELNASSEQYDEENCAHSHLLQDTEPCTVVECEPDLKFSEGIQRNSAPNMLHNTEETSADQHLQDLQYIFSKPGPSFPYLDTLKLSK